MYIERSRVISAEAILAITVADALSGLGRAAWAPSMATYNVDSKWKPKLVCLLQAMLIMEPDGNIGTYQPENSLPLELHVEHHERCSAEAEA